MFEHSAENVVITSQNQSVPQEPLLPRSPWNSQVAYLRTVFRAKKALDLLEQEVGETSSIFNIQSYGSKSSLITLETEELRLIKTAVKHRLI